MMMNEKGEIVPSSEVLKKSSSKTSLVVKVPDHSTDHRPSKAGETSIEDDEAVGRITKRTSSYNLSFRGTSLPSIQEMRKLIVSTHEHKPPTYAEKYVGKTRLNLDLVQQMLPQNKIVPTAVTQVKAANKKKIFGQVKASGSPKVVLKDELKK